MEQTIPYDKFLDVYNTSTITWIDVSEGTREE
jgi:hypothetical protein